MRSKYLTRTYRLVVAFIAPPILGSVMFIMYSLIEGGRTGAINLDLVFKMIGKLPIIIFFAFIFVGLQSVAYSIIMEFAVRPIVRNQKYFILVSCILGFLSGLLPGIAVDALDKFFLPTGILVGVAVGFLIYTRSNEVEEQNA